MLILRTLEELPSINDAELRHIIRARLELLHEEGDEGKPLGFVQVLQDQDSLGQLQEHLGFSVLENRRDGSRFGQPEFHPSFELIEEHSTCYEIVIVLSDDGYGAFVFVPKQAQLDPDLLTMCRQYAVETSP